MSDLFESRPSYYNFLSAMEKESLLYKEGISPETSMEISAFLNSIGKSNSQYLSLSLRVASNSTDYFTKLDDNQIQLVISYIKDINPYTEIKPKRNLSDLKGKIQFADNYDYKAMRSL